MTAHEIAGWSEFLTGLLVFAAPVPLEWLMRRLTGRRMDSSLGCGLAVGGITMMLFGALSLAR